VKARCLRYSSPMKEQTGKAGKPPVDQGNTQRSSLTQPRVCMHHCRDSIFLLNNPMQVVSKKHPKKLSHILYTNTTPPYHKYPLNSPDIRQISGGQGQEQGHLVDRDSSSLWPQQNCHILLWDFLQDFRRRPAKLGDF
jgi:hypothetical protein